MIDKLKKNKFLSSTLILLSGGFISKLLGFFIRIIVTRRLGVEAMGLYSLIMPTFSLLIIIATLSFPISISKLISANNRSSKKIIFSVIPVSLILNIISIIIIILISKPLSTYLLRDERLYIPIICSSLTLPFIGLSSIIKGYYWGKQRMGIYILSNITEQIVRIIIISLLIPIYIKKSIISTISMIILVNIISETSSIIVMILGLPKGIIIKKEDIKPSCIEIKDTLSISLPNTISKVIGSISHFLEPILLTNILSFKGYPLSYIVREYGIINGYVIPLLLLPCFFTQSISTSLLPEISKYYSKGNIKMCKKRIIEITTLSFIIGFISILLIFINPEYFLNLIYKTNEGIIYIKILGPFFLLYFIETPLSSALQSLNKTKEAFIISTISSAVKILLITILSFLNFKMNSLILSIIISTLISTYLYIKKVIYSLK